MKWTADKINQRMEKAERQERELREKISKLNAQRAKILEHIAKTTESLRIHDFKKSLAEIDGEIADAESRRNRILKVVIPKLGAKYADLKTPELI